MSLAYRCEICSADKVWSLTRQGDVVHTWACSPHLGTVLMALQRDHEVTRIEVVYHPKAVEWAEISRALREIEES